MPSTLLNAPQGLPAGAPMPSETAAAGPNRRNGGALHNVNIPAGFFGPPPGHFSGKDLYQLMILPFLAVIAWTVPDRLSAGLCRGLAALLYRLRPGRYGGYARLFAALSSENHARQPLDRLVREAIAMRQLERLQLLRYHRPRGWTPQVRLQGKEHLDRALAAGKGAILWGPHSPFSEVIFKKALHDNGYADWHVSRHDHGHFSSTRFGVRFLNPIRIKVEDRYLAERVVIDPSDPTSGLAMMAGLLAKNRVLSITVQPFSSRLTRVPYGQTELLLPSGPPLLSIKSGAPLLPIFTERCPDGSFLVTIEAPLETASGASRPERVAQMLCGLARLMHAHFLRLPSQYHYAQLLGASEQLNRQLTSETGQKCN